MTLIDTCVFGLLVAGIVVAIIELGLSADVVSWFDPYYENTDAAQRSDFLLFCSIWSLLVTAFLLASPFLGSRVHSHKFASPLTLILTAVTMIFWLAGFAAFANLFFGAPTGTVGATLAFAVIAWLIYLALFIFNCLTAFSIRSSERPGWTPVGRVRFEKRQAPAATA